jgi:hypothetical protein
MIGKVDFELCVLESVHWCLNGFCEPDIGGMMHSSVVCKKIYVTEIWYVKMVWLGVGWVWDFRMYAVWCKIC